MSQVAKIQVPGSNKVITVNTGLFINNEFVPSSDSQEKITSVPFVTVIHAIMQLMYEAEL